MDTRHRTALQQACRRPESECTADLVREWTSVAVDRAAIAVRARRLITGLRERPRPVLGVDDLMHEFSLSTREGVALMCLAEALLRIPDPATVDRLIRDKISGANWQSHLAHSHSLFVNAASWGLLLTGKLLSGHAESSLGEILQALVRRGGEPLIRRGMLFAMRLLGERFVMGETMVTALARARQIGERGYTFSFDMLGEAALTTAEAERYCAAYAGAIEALGAQAIGRPWTERHGISIKLSALHPRYSRGQKGRVMAELLPRLRHLAVLASQAGIGLNLDAEESERLELSLELFAELARDPDLAGWPGLGFVVQAYQKRCPVVVDCLIALARSTGRRLMVRLVKGAYWDSEIKRAQVDGLSDYPVFTRKAHTDLCYLVSARRLLAASDCIYPQFATHNAQTLASVEALAQAIGTTDYEFQCLHGMGEPLYDQIVGRAHSPARCRIYAPVGSHRTLLPYLVRRLLENGANTSFVNQLLDEQVSLDQLLADPLALTQGDGGGRHPSLPLPQDLFAPERLNSPGFDLADEATLATVDRWIEASRRRAWQAQALVAGLSTTGLPGRIVLNPANPDDVLGQVFDASPVEIEQALANAARTGQHWRQSRPAERVACLRRAAEGFIARADEFVPLLIREAGKTRANAIAELREAVDFCRYYAQAAGECSAGEGLGPVVCISPWNFPLAIFVGQIAAALAAGRVVIAKPAEQTSLIAARAMEVLHAAGFPEAVLQCLPGTGESVGARLVADPRVHGVLFTGSAEVARQINRALARRPDSFLIAETGGQNAMIVDSSALPEQVVQDVLTAGFDSAGQRCSALRVLCLQEEIADTTLALLRAAMQEWTVGDPLALESDVGPVIDAAARDQLLAYLADAEARGRVIATMPLPAEAGASGGFFVPPTLLRIDSLDELAGEVFGPVVHVLRYPRLQLPALVEAINASGYGLTLGIHSRIDETVQSIVASARVGNVYVNRNQIGAVVGSQPFGGRGLSGTGPKAGGPFYVRHLAGEAVISPNCHGPVRRFERSTACFETLRQWANTLGDAALQDDCQQCAEHSWLGCELALPGPTGERNTLRFAPLGRLLCHADDSDGLLRQLAAVWATGNVAVTLNSPPIESLLSALPADLSAQVVRIDVDQLGTVDGALAQRFDPEFSRALAQLDGAIRPLWLASSETGTYPLHRLVAERVLTFNTTAAGGNTALMRLSE